MAPEVLTWKFIPELNFYFRTAGRIGAISKMQGVYTGFCATLLRDIPFSMIYFPAYAIIRDVMAKNMLKPGEDPTFGKFSLVGYNPSYTGETPSYNES